MKSTSRLLWTLALLLAASATLLGLLHDLSPPNPDRYYDVHWVSWSAHAVIFLGYILGSFAAVWVAGSLATRDSGWPHKHAYLFVASAAVLASAVISKAVETIISFGID